MEQKCEECGQEIRPGEIWYCACGKKLCATCFISPPHCYHIEGETQEEEKE